MGDPMVVGLSGVIATVDGVDAVVVEELVNAVFDASIVVMVANNVPCPVAICTGARTAETTVGGNEAGVLSVTSAGTN